ncbi:hypothetical protein [Reichenbachiella sp.]|uniref:hypothetical protein n=1 Tax=Reichenbachiella sp. TaxID=2184521 RepID=UPI003BAF9C88
MKPKTLIFTSFLVISGIFGFRAVNEFIKSDKCLDSEGSWNYELGICEEFQLNLESSIWTTEGTELFNGDSLTFINSTDVEYFMGEYDWTFDSKYELNSNTLKVLTKTVAFEVDDVSKLPPDLEQTFHVTQDSLILIELRNKKNGGWELADENRLNEIKNFARVR